MDEKTNNDNKKKTENIFDDFDPQNLLGGFRHDIIVSHFAS